MKNDSSEEDIPEITPEIRSLCGSLQILASGCGLLVNAYVFYLNRSSRNNGAFKFLCLTKCIMNFYICGQYLIFQAPMTLGNFTYASIKTNDFLSALQNNLYMNLEYIAVIIAANRFCAIYFPKKFSTVNGEKLIKIILLLLFFERLYATVRHTLYDCSLIYDGISMRWQLVKYPEDCERLVTFDSVLNYTVLVLVVSVLLNVTTCAKVVYFYLTQFNSHNEAINKNCKLFLQTFAQDCLFIIDMLFMNDFILPTKHPLLAFISYSLVGQLVHVMDGVITIVWQPNSIKPTPSQHNPSGSRSILPGTV